MFLFRFLVLHQSATTGLHQAAPPEVPERAKTGMQERAQARVQASAQAELHTRLRLRSLRTAILRRTSLNDWHRLFIPHFFSSYFLRILFEFQAHVNSLHHLDCTHGVLRVF